MVMGIRRRAIAIDLVAAALTGACSGHGGHGREPSPEVVTGEVPEAENPYSEYVEREIRALPESDIHALLDGEGAGFALSAELNSYPGPQHVLEHSTDLSLSDDQLEDTRSVFRSMRESARNLGARAVELEAELEELFRSASVDRESLDTLLTELHAVYGELRGVHLAAHIDMVDVLSERQIDRYNELRGYHSGEPGEHRDHDHHDHQRHDH